MLVLSRGPEDRICFPTLGVNIEIIRVDGNRVRVGIDAPREIPVLRHELVEKSEYSATENAVSSPSKHSAKPQVADKGPSHDMRNKLNSANLALNLAVKQLDAGMSEKAMQTLHKALRSYDQLEEEVAPTSKPTPNQPRALLVEDNERERSLLAEILRLSGFEVDTAEDGLQALVYLSRSRAPDVVLMDINMPRFNGVQTIDAIRENPEFAAMQVYAVTGEDRDTVKIEVGPKGIDGWFQKPYNPRELVDHLQGQFEMHATSPMAV
ncbi:response regulator [Adhaeretor mobilis]|uniref:Translational regulator CsrA n=1 Tax=Adhaeretor mobilis TaxID=1930276 RepID=A0A517N2F0_9BACT|nr:response regulator [Adhaeretor mobilis]QDT01319.1 CAI-1 autoinducer sensor kinase/phosphatase CqsS [Adhaeretor mobilis]